MTRRQRNAWRRVRSGFRRVLRTGMILYWCRIERRLIRFDPRKQKDVD